jgi:endoglucanase
MPRFRVRATAAFGVAAVLAITLVTEVFAARSAPPASAAVAGLVRVNQVGYAASGAKEAFLLAKGAATGAQYAVLDAAGSTAAAGSIGASLGSWNSTYPDVYLIDFTAVQAAGTYHIQVSGTATASSPAFRIDAGSAVYGPLTANAVAFFQAQRDGSAVIAGVLNRKPAHLNDGSASVYANPTFESSDSDTIVGSSLSKLAGPVNVAGGWFDAGDYLKFTHTTAYADTLLGVAQRTLGSAAPAGLPAEQRQGLDWLGHMWDPASRTLYLQVGIGSGNSTGSFVGDHDVWRLPEVDDGDTASADKYLAHRPVFRAASPGAAISPNLAGRFAAAFAVAAQLDAAGNPTRAASELSTAAAVYGMAKTSSVGTLVTAQPREYYPEDSWTDDMELGGAELALAGQAVGDSRAGTWLSQAAHWANTYISAGGGDTFNLYDTSALAHADLAAAITAAGSPSGLEVGTAQLTADLKRQLDGAKAVAGGDPFHAGITYNDFDADSHAFGVAVTVRLYRKLTGSTAYNRLAVQQADWTLGGNAWGSSFVIGAGSRFPQCPQHQVANLAGSLSGGTKVLLGAVVNGPNDSTLFSSIDPLSDGMRQCPTGGGDAFSQFTGHGSRFMDDVRVWQSDEPALDMTATSLLAFALLSQT